MSGTLMPTQTSDTVLRGKPLFFARVGWVMAALATVGLDLYAIPALYHDTLTPCPDQGSCGSSQFMVSQVAMLHDPATTMAIIARLTVVEQTAATLLFAALAAVIFWRRSEDRMALFAAYTLVIFGGASFNGAMQALPDMNSTWFVPVMTLDNIGQVLFIGFFLVFPDGRFVPRWTRWVVVIWTLAWLTDYFPNTTASSIGTVFIAGPLFVVLLIILVAAQVYRFRRVSNERQRQQTKWVVYGFAFGLGSFAVLLAVANLVLSGLNNDDPVTEFISSVAIYVFISLIPITIGIAILRSRLYDIDIIIRRTLVYGSLTAILVTIYLIGVVGVQALLGRVAGQAVRQQPVLIVATTLLIAALFQPLRRRLQKGIDQRFYRSKYNTARILATFGTALRSEVELAQLQDHLLAAVEETMQPARVSLWLRQIEQQQAAEGGQS